MTIIVVQFFRVLCLVKMMAANILLKYGFSFINIFKDGAIINAEADF